MSKDAKQKQNAQSRYKLAETVGTAAEAEAAHHERGEAEAAKPPKLFRDSPKKTAEAAEAKAARRIIGYAKPQSRSRSREAGYRANMEEIAV